MNLEILRRGLTGGFRPAFLVGCGSTAADLVYIALVYLGVSPFLQQAAFRIVLDSAGALLLGGLAFQNLRAAAAPSVTEAREEVGAPSPRGALATGFAITLSNPMTIVFYLSLFGGAVATLHEASRGEHLVLVGGVLGGCLIWSLFLALLLGWGGRRIGPRLRRGISVASAAVLLYFAVRFLAEGVEEVLGLSS